MRHDILSRPKETAKLDIYSGSIYHAEDLGGAFVFVESNRDVWLERSSYDTPQCFGSAIRPFFNDSCVGQRSCVYSESAVCLLFFIYICTTAMSGLRCARVLSCTVVALGWNSVEPQSYTLAQE